MSSRVTPHRFICVAIPPRLLALPGGGIIARSAEFKYGEYAMEFLTHGITGLALGLAIATFGLSLRNSKKIAALQETQDGGNASLPRRRRLMSLFDDLINYELCYPGAVTGFTEVEGPHCGELLTVAVDDPMFSLCHGRL